jgi:hypothetical protein
MIHHSIDSVRLHEVARSEILVRQIETFNVGNEMKVQVWELLVLPSIDDQPAGQVHKDPVTSFYNQAG